MTANLIFRKNGTIGNGLTNHDEILRRCWVVCLGGAGRKFFRLAGAVEEIGFPDISDHFESFNCNERNF